METTEKEKLNEKEKLKARKELFVDEAQVQ